MLLKFYCILKDILVVGLLKTALWSAPGGLGSLVLFYFVVVIVLFLLICWIPFRNVLRKNKKTHDTFREEQSSWENINPMRGSYDHMYVSVTYMGMLLQAYSQGKWVKHASRFNWHICEPHVLLTVLLGAHCGFRLIRGSNAPPRHQDRLCEPQGVHYWFTFCLHSCLCISVAGQAQLGGFLNKAESLNCPPKAFKFSPLGKFYIIVPYLQEAPLTSKYLSWQG